MKKKTNQIIMMACIFIFYMTSAVYARQADFLDSDRIFARNDIKSVFKSIPDTGQEKCYNDSTEINCGQTYGQDANYMINPRSYTKLDVEDNWIMVMDNQTGLMWEVKTDDGTIHDKDRKFSPNNVNTEFIDFLNTNRFGGYADWRLPTIHELMTIADHSRYKPAIDTDYFPDTQSYFYISENKDSYEPNVFVWGFNYEDGKTLKITKKDIAYYARAVRGDKLPQAEFKGDGPITCITTGMMWEQPGINQINWSDAIDHCENLSSDGFTDWRLPSMNELRTLADFSTYEPAIDPKFINASIYSHWSSTTSKLVNSYACSVVFDFGYGLNVLKSEKRVARCVRGGQHKKTGNLYILTPTQGGNWGFELTQTITWETQNINDTVDISISYEGGRDGTFLTIADAEKTENDGEYIWQKVGDNAPANLSRPFYNCMIKIEPTNNPDKGTQQGLFTIDAYDSPVAEFTVSNVDEYAPTTVEFTDKSTDTYNSISSWKWDFGDGTAASNEQNPTHKYEHGNKFAVKLAVTGKGGESLKTLDIDIKEPETKYDVAEAEKIGPVPHKVTFIDQSEDFSGIGSWEWDFGDGNTSTDQNPTHTYNTNGEYTVSLSLVRDGVTFNISEVNKKTITVQNIVKGEVKIKYGEETYGLQNETVTYSNGLITGTDTTENGLFEFVDVEPGNYNLYLDYNTQTQRDLGQFTFSQDSVTTIEGPIEIPVYAEGGSSDCNPCADGKIDMKDVIYGLQILTDIRDCPQNNLDTH